jgi:hypothetical protein
MHHWIVSLFRILSAIVFLALVAGPAVAGAAWGQMLDQLGGKSQYTLIYGFAGGLGGLVLATWSLGLVHVMIEISENTSRLIALQERTVELLSRAQGIKQDDPKRQRIEPQIFA